MAIQAFLSHWRLRGWTGKHSGDGRVPRKLRLFYDTGIRADLTGFSSRWTLYDRTLNKGCRLSTTANYRTAPDASTTMPPGIPFIVGNEAAERFSFYGMKTVLYIYMTQYLVHAGGAADFMNPEEAKSKLHLFVASAYFFPIFGAILSDWLWGKYRTIFWLSLVYCLGHLALATIEGRTGLYLGLLLIAVGAGGIKPCVSAHVGDQFGEQNQHLMNKVFGWFYFSINFGSFFSTILTPWLLELPEDAFGASYRHLGPHLAFGLPGLLMMLATFVFWIGRNRFVHVPPGGTQFLRETFSPEGLGALLRLIPLFLFVSIFWALYDQTGSAWVEQATHMDLTFFRSGEELKGKGIWELKASQVQALNPILVMIYIPVFAYGIYPLLNRFFKVTELGKVAIGLFLTVIAFGLSGLIETWITAGDRPGVIWQVLAYMILTAAEIFVSITCLEFAYTQSPTKMKSLVMSFYLLSISLGNFLTSAVNHFIQNADGTSRLPGASYYWFFTGLMLVTAIAFLPYAWFYKEKRYFQHSKPTRPCENCGELLPWNQSTITTSAPCPLCGHINP